MQRILTLSFIQVILVTILHKIHWTRDTQMFERYRIWKKKVEFIFYSALADANPKQLVSYLKYWMGDPGIPLIAKWESTGKLDYSNAEETLSHISSHIFS